MIISSGYNIAAPGGRGGAAQAPRGRRVRGGRRARRGARLGGQGVRRASRRVARPRREGARAAGLRQGRDRAVQVPPRRSSSSTSFRAPRPASCSGSGCGRTPDAVDVAPAAADPVALRSLRPRGGQLALGGVADRVDGRPRHRLRGGPVVGVAAEAAGRARGRAPGRPGRATRCRPSSLEVLREGDRRIWSRPRATAADGWLVLVFSVPESERERRHALRSLLARLGFGTAAPGVWVAPATLYDETVRALDRDGLTAYTELFRGDYLGAGDVAARIGEWWDLASLTALYSDFCRAYRPVARRRVRAVSGRRVRDVRPDADRVAAAAVPRPRPAARAPATRTGRASRPPSCSPRWTPGCARTRTPTRTRSCTAEVERLRDSSRAPARGLPCGSWSRSRPGRRGWGLRTPRRRPAPRRSRPSPQA